MSPLWHSIGDGTPHEHVTCGRLVIYPRARAAFWGTTSVDLTSSEFNIVNFLVSRAGDYVSYSALYRCRDRSTDSINSEENKFLLRSRTNTRSFIKRIREKFRKVDAAFSEIQNYAAFGYRWRTAVPNCRGLATTEGGKCTEYTSRSSEVTLEIGKLTVRPDVSRVTWDGLDVNLTVTEFGIIHLLVSNRGEYVTYRSLYDCVHHVGFVAGSGDDGFRINVRSMMRRVRKKFHQIDRLFGEIENYPALGYRWRAGSDMRFGVSEYARPSGSERADSRDIGASIE